MVERDHDERLTLLRHNLAESIAEEERLYQRRVEGRSTRDRWRQRAELALRKGQQELARQALEQAARHDRLASTHGAEFEVQRQHVDRLKRRLRQMERLSSPSGLTGERQAIDRVLMTLEYDPIADRFAQLEREEQLDSQLAELKMRLAKKDAS